MTRIRTSFNGHVLPRIENPLSMCRKHGYWMSAGLATRGVYGLAYPA